MTISINPYADQINFPPGTPASVINAVLGIRARSDAIQAQQANQPTWWESGINNAINGFSSQLLFPWLQNEFVNLPYQTDLSNMKADTAMRQYAGEQGTLTSELSNRTQNAYDLANQGYERFGSALNDVMNAYKPTPESMTDTGTTTPYGAYEDPWTSSPGPQYSPPLNNFGPTAPTGDQPQLPGTEPTQMQGDIAPVSRDRIMTYTPEKQPTTADMFRTVAGNNPLSAGIIADAFQKNQNLSRLLDPLYQQKLQEETRRTGAQTENLESQATSRNAQLGPIIDNLQATGALTKEKADLVRAQVGLTNTKAQTEAVKLNWLEQADPKMLEKYFIHGGSSEQKPPASVAARMAVIQAHNPQLTPVEALAQAIREQDQANPNNQLLLSQSRLPIELARNELPKLETNIRELQSFTQNLETVNTVMQRLGSSGLLPENNSWQAQFSAMKARALHPELYNSDEVNGALEVLARMKNGISVGYDRQVLGDKGARVAPAYNLPKDPTMVSLPAWNGYYDALKQGLTFDLGNNMDFYNRSKADALGTRFGNPSITGPSSIQSTTPPKTGLPPGLRSTP